MTIFDNILNVLLPNYPTHAIFKFADRFKSHHFLGFVLALCMIGFYAHMGQAGIIKVAGIKLQVLHTPGHTPGGICLYSKGEGIVFTDDTLFANGVGRADLGGNMEQLIKSIKEKLFTLPDETAVYPGHGPTTTIAQEKKSNPFL